MLGTKTAEQAAEVQEEVLIKHSVELQGKWRLGEIFQNL